MAEEGDDYYTHQDNDECIDLIETPKKAPCDGHPNHAPNSGENEYPNEHAESKQTNPL